MFSNYAFDGEKMMTTKHTPKESSVVTTILKYLKQAGCKAEKTHGGQFGAAGKPDITGALPLPIGAKTFGLRFELEVKRDKKGYGATALQKATLAEWQAVGAITAVVCSKAEVIEIIETAQKEWAELWRSDHEINR
jgi:hypothetical protein